jgi:hypothetical protein
MAFERAPQWPAAFQRSKGKTAIMIAMKSLDFEWGMDFKLIVENLACKY